MPSRRNLPVRLVSAIPLAAYASRFGTKLMRAFAKLGSSLFDERIFVEVPASLAGWSEGSVGHFRFASALRKRGFLTQWHEVFRDFPDEPLLYAFECAKGGEVVSNGFDFRDKAEAVIRALAECYERTLWKDTVLEKQHATATARAEDLRGRVMHPAAVAGFSAGDRERLHLLPLDDGAVFRFVRARSVTTKGSVWAPLQLFDPSYCSAVMDGAVSEPLLRTPVTTGLATGRSLDEALLRGMLEVIERDAFMIAYLNRLSCSRIDARAVPDPDGGIAELLGRFARHGLALHLTALPTDFPVHVVLATIEDRSGIAPTITVGARAGFDLGSCIIGAAAEALYGRYVYRREKLEMRALPQSPTGYDHLDRIAYWGMEGRASEISFFTADDRPIYSRSLAAPENFAEGILLIADHARRVGEEFAYIEFADELGKDFGLHTVYVVSPGLQPMHLAERFRYHGGERLRSLPRTLGLEAAPQLNPVPHPFP